jgi:hypothetical protein
VRAFKRICRQTGIQSLINTVNNDGQTPDVLPLPNKPLYALCAKISKNFERDIRCPHKKMTLQWRKILKFTFDDGNFKMKRMYTKRQYQQLNKSTDLYITGSDQIWNPFCGGYNPMMFVEFGQEIKRIAYSSSISLSTIPPAVKDRMTKALSKFSHIAVREQKSVDLLSEMLKRNDIKLVVDPTYLLSAEQWHNFGMRANIEFQVPDKYIFCYFVGAYRADLYEQMVQDVKKVTGISQVITLCNDGGTISYGDGMLYKDAGPYEFIYLLEHANYVCSDSFHATVIAFKFQKDFVHATKNVDTEISSSNTRMYDILSRYGLMNKVYKGDGTQGWMTPVDYSKVTPIIESEIKDSIEFLDFEINN